VKKAFNILLLFLSFLTLGNSQSQVHLDDLDKLFNNLSSNDEFNGNVIISKGNDIIYQRSYGFADFENQVPNSKESIFELASMGKQFTAMGIMILKEKGRLDFDKKVSEYLQKFPYPNISIRQLLTMSSGIPDYLNFSADWDLNSIVNNKAILEFYRTVQPELNFESGTKFEYSNVNYVCLAEIIKSVSGQSFSEFLKEEIFDKLGMSSTRSYTTRFTENEVVLNYAYPHIKSSNEYFKVEDFPRTRYVVAASGIEGDGSIISTTEDLLKWNKTIKTGKLVSLELIEEAYSKSQFSNGGENNYGFGMYIYESNY